MAAIYETAYPRLDSSFKDQELVELFTPTHVELSFVKKQVPDIAGRLSLLTLLKVFQHLGYFPLWSAIPKEVPDHLANCLGYLFQVEVGEEYDRSGARSRHMQYIRSFLDVQPVTEQTYACMKQTALKAAQTKEHLGDIINIMIEELVRQRFELPAFSRFNREAIAARTRVNENCFELITSQLTPAQKQQLDWWLEQKNEEGWSWWKKLKYEPPAPSMKNIRSYLEHIDWLKGYFEQLPLKADLPDAKRRQFAYEAYACDLPHIRQLKPSKRYAFIIILIEYQMGKVFDNLILMFIRRVFKMRNDAKTALENYHEKSRERVSRLIEKLAQIGSAYQIKGNDLERFRAIEAVMPEQPQEMIDQCHHHLAYIQNNYLLCLLPLYKNKRSLLFNCLVNLELEASSQDSSLLDAIDFILLHRNSRKEWIEYKEQLSLEWIPDRWRKLVTGKASSAAQVTHVHRKYFELCIFLELVRQLESGDIFISQTQQFDDYTKNLISWKEYEHAIKDFELISGIPTSTKAFVDKVKSELIMAAQRTDQAFPANQYARIERGKLILRKLKKKKSPEDYPHIDQQLKSRMAPIGILQLLNYTEKWLNLHRRFHHFSGQKSRIENYPKRFISTLFCYGCFMGPTQAARSIEGVSRKQLAWIHDHHINEERLNNAITKVVNTYKQFQLPQYWGTGESTSADGTHWSTYQRNLFSQYHLRYGDYGGVGYYHVSDTYIALFSHFIPCGVYEALYILDGLIKNESEIKPNIVHGDTHAQSTVVFGLAYLLGIKLMPRIRNIKNLILFRPDKTTSFQHVEELFSDTINWKLIEKHLPDMLRVVLSIKKGKITPSTILRRLGSQSRKNKLYYAFRELGRTVRTIFLLDYIHDIELRRIIFAATNKSEEFNQFSDWVAFASNVIPENLQHEQSKIIKYNHLVSNLIILYNVDEMTRVFNELVEEGYPITSEILGAFAPYRTEHINRFGSYSEELKRALHPLQHYLDIIKKP